MNILVTGGAGFIGSHFCKRLLAENNNVTVIDNMMLGSKDNLKEIMDHKEFTLYEFDLMEYDKLIDLFEKDQYDLVIHLAANSDIQASSINPTIDYKNTFMTTYHVLECMRIHEVKNLIFASTSAIYGDKKCLIDENMGPLLPISYYGGAKLASEGFISAYTYMNNMSTCVFRFPNVIGENLTHGVIFDFINKLKKNPDELTILGNGLQEKTYIYIQDLIDAIMFVYKQSDDGYNFYNVSSQGKTTVNRIADIICKEMSLTNTKYLYTGGNVGWKGDVPTFEYNYDKIRNLGWNAKYSSDEAVQLTVRRVLEDESSNSCRG
jgi:UDP-glucose 4-epimerase